MMTRQVGWALSLHAILRTADGGRHWTVSRRLSGDACLGWAGLVALDRRHV